MSIVFPPNPAVGDEHVDSGGTAWVWDGMKWTTNPGLASQGGYLPLSGGSLSGPLQLAADPTTPLEAATKEYVDDNVIAVTVSDTAPLSPRNGALWFDSMSCQLFVSYSDPSSQQWVIAVNGIAALENYLPLTGGTMTGGVNITGGLSSGWASGSGLAINTPNASSIALNAPNGSVNGVSGFINGKERWLVALGNGASETGSNVGSDFQLNRYDDTGAYLGTPFSISRANGGAIFYDNLTVHGSNIAFDNVTNAGFLVNSDGSSDPLVIGAPYGAYARTKYNITNTRLWSAGAFPNANFGISDESGGVTILTLGYYGTTSTLTGSFSISGSLGVDGGITSLNQIDAVNNFRCRAGANGATSNGFNFYWDGSGHLYGFVDSSNQGYVTFASDYRIKKDIQPLGGTWELVKALKPISYSQKEYTPPNTPLKEDGGPPDPMFRADDNERWGFVAHELQETLIESAASGVKDQPDCIQSPNPWTVIAALTSALQEAMARIEALEAAR